MSDDTEQLVQYDRDNKAEYDKVRKAEDLLQRAGKDGFKKPTNKEIAHAKEVIHDYRRTKAQTFLEEHKKRIVYYGVEIKAYFDEDFFKQSGMIRPSLTIADFNPHKKIAPVKPWSEALEENLVTRINCHHELGEDEASCKHCGLNPENWGGDNEGVADDYQDRQRAKIAEHKETEAACARGEHELNDEAKKDENATMQFCVHCRKPKSEWGNAQAEA